MRIGLCNALSDPTKTALRRQSAGVPEGLTPPARVEPDRPRAASGIDHKDTQKTCLQRVDTGKHPKAPPLRGRQEALIGAEYHLERSDDHQQANRNVDDALAQMTTTE